MALISLIDGKLDKQNNVRNIRSFVRWPKIDKDIEDLCYSCSGCQKHSNMLKSAPLHPWDWPKDLWQRLHIDFAGPFMNSML